LLIVAFLARAPLYLSVFPPFEGWDEYQHLAYIAHLDETGTIPVFDESWVSAALRPLLISVPHSQWGGDQVRQWGVQSYPEYWNSAVPRPDAEGEAPTVVIRLYQAQQPPLAYAVALPVWRAFGSAHRLDAIYAIRTMNVLLVAGALVLFAAALTRLVPEFAPRVAVLALVCLYPLFFQNVARVFPPRRAVVDVELPALWDIPHNAGLDSADGTWVSALRACGVVCRSAVARDH
jgi:hypothetical protein